MKPREINLKQLYHEQQGIPQVDVIGMNLSDGSIAYDLLISDGEVAITINCKSVNTATYAANEIRESIRKAMGL